MHQWIRCSWTCPFNIIESDATSWQMNRIDLELSCTLGVARMYPTYLMDYAFILPEYTMNWFKNKFWERKSIQLINSFSLEVYHAIFIHSLLQRTTCRNIIQTHYTKSISILTFLVVHVTFVHISVITAWGKGNTCRVVLFNYRHWYIFLSCWIVFGYIRQII